MFNSPNSPPICVCLCACVPVRCVRALISEIMQLMQNPAVMAKLQQMMSNPGQAHLMMNDPDLQKIFAKLQGANMGNAPAAQPSIFDSRYTHTRTLTACVCASPSPFDCFLYHILCTWLSFGHVMCYFPQP